MLTYYVTSLCVDSFVRRWHTKEIPQHLCQFQPYCACHEFSHNWKIEEYSQLILTSFNYIIEAWFIFWGVLLGILVVFCPPFLYLGDEHGTWSTCLFQMTCSYHLFIFMSCPQPHGYIWFGFIPSAVCRFSNKYSSSLRYGKFSFK